MKFHGKEKNTFSILFSDAALTFETYKDVLLSARWAGVQSTLYLQASSYPHTLILLTQPLPYYRQRSNRHLKENPGNGISGHIGAERD